ncbi:DUF6098 family protein [Nocardia sp. CDC159]|uniref:DUF6098 family protein n=1 Tax=Nocardia pulmonis TaxID=2951408 RepID=A0A9X2J1I3_9NOCA|nr:MULTISPECIES: DUF6098 family protein [Nocardia]MCM6778120.1 DUF6098 family protein [Nocardia pulmonis]MCM6791009.1 DUF6098 family protein [Nocardia sp. CDC159]
MSDLPVVETLDELTEVVTEQPLYLRYSHGPEADAEAGPSRDYEAEVDLPGLSVTTLGPEPWWPRPARDWVARRLCKYAELAVERGRFGWLLAGREVGHGPDHEPIVTDVQPVARIADRVIDEAQRVYHDRFQVGRDSRD